MEKESLIRIPTQYISLLEIEGLRPIGGGASVASERQEGEEELLSFSEKEETIRSAFRLYLIPPETDLFLYASIPSWLVPTMGK